MTRLFEVFRFELAHHFRRGSTVFYFLVAFAIAPMLMKVMAGGPRDDGSFNSPFTLLSITVFGSMLALVMMAAFAGDAATRDTETRSDALFYTSPVGKRAYVLGRFLGAFVMSALLLLAFPAGCLFATVMPLADASNLLPIHLSAYFAPYVFFALPNAFIATALLFAAALRARRGTASYATGAFLFFGALICGKLLATRVGLNVATLLDPLGFTTLNTLMRTLTALQKNTFVAKLDGALLASRLLWLAIATSVVAITYARFRFAHHAVKHSSIPLLRRFLSRGSSSTASVPRILETNVRHSEEPKYRGEVRLRFGTSTRLRQLLAITMRSFRELHTSRAWWIVPMLAVLFILQAPALARNELGIPQSLTTARVVDFLTSDVSILFTLLIALSAGELVWRERGARMHALTGVTPVPDSLPVVGKFLGLVLMLVTMLTIFFVAGVAVQSIHGADRIDVALYVELLYGLLLPEYLLIAALAMIIHVVVNQKYVGNVIVVLVPVARDLVQRLGVEDRLLLYGSLPSWTYSDIAGLGPSTNARLWFTLYYGGWALLFAIATHLFWVRGEERGVRQRFSFARRRFRRTTALLSATALAVIAGAGGFIFYNTHIRYEYRTSTDIEQRRAAYERSYGRYASLPQPTLVATKLRVEFYPQHRTAKIGGSYRLLNRSNGAIATVHVVTPENVESSSVSFDRAARMTRDDERLDYRIYTLDRALAPGESLQMNFAVDIRTRTFDSRGTAPVVRNGSFITHRPRDGSSWLPLVGYQAARELDDPATREKYGLRKRAPYPRLGDVAVGNEKNGYESIDLETTIGTDAGQIGVAPGALRRRWTQNGRSYVQYVTDAPISNAWTITSANYAVQRAEWRSPTGSQQPVEIEIFHHPTHKANLDRMIRGVQASLDYDTRAFGSYPYRQIRLVEYPSDADVGGMTAHSGLLTYAEGFALMRPEADPRHIDYPFAIVAHEMGHQWWGHRLTPAVVEGAPFLSESLAWYSGMLVVEETLGRDHLQRLLDVMRADYLQPNQPRTVPLLRGVDQVDAYRRGPFAMDALRERVGVEPVNRALRNLLAKFPPGRAPYPTSLDFYAELRAATPPSAHSLLRDLFEEITFWDVRMKRIEVKRDTGGAYRVTMRIEAQKLKGDSSGAARPVTMDDPVEILLYDAERKPIYRASHHIHSGEQTIELTVTRAPAGGVIDPDHELLDREPDDNEAQVTGGTM